MNCVKMMVSLSDKAVDYTVDVTEIKPGEIKPSKPAAPFCTMLHNGDCAVLDYRSSVGLQRVR